VVTSQLQSSAGQGKFAGQRLMCCCCATQL